MTKIDLKKNKKRQDILNSAYELFTTIGYAKTTILGIALAAGVGKGTFYLYYKSKEDVRNELIIRNTSRILKEAVNAMEAAYSDSASGEGNASASSAELPDPDEVSDGFIFIADYILNYLSNDMTQLKFISKNLSWGLFFESNYITDGGEDVINFKEFIWRMLKQRRIELRNPDLLIFTIIEMINSTCYSVLTNNDPVSFEEYKPYLYHCIRLLVKDAIV